MVTAGRRKPGVQTGRLSRSAVLMLLALGSQLGCTREFYREWANQDVSEAVFEKSRDPRWRLDAFSIEPPALSRFADPYDQDFPPAPPDDPAAEALSPVPQWPDNRLIVPVEANGYLTMLERWREERLEGEAKAQPAGNVPGASETSAPPRTLAAPPSPSSTPSPFAPGVGAPRPPAAGTGPTPAGSNGPGNASPPQNAAPVPATPSGPGAGATRNPGANSGTNAASSTPILVADERAGKTEAAIPPPRPASSFSPQENSRAKGLTDGAVQRTSQQQPQPNAIPTGPLPGQAPGGADERSRRPIIPLDPGQAQPGMADPMRQRVNQMVPAGPGGVFNQEQAAELASVLVPAIAPMDHAWAVGLPRRSRPYVVTMQQAFTLALLNARVYQLQLENLYSAALQVTLQRFAFQPQFYAGMSPLTSPLGAGFPGLSPLNRFTYQTRVAPGGQVSTLQMGEIAGYGKLLNSGGQLLMGFANQIVFNFVGKNPIQPTVQSSLPLSFVQPFLRGGGRAVILELLTQAERTLLYQTRIFAKFRQEFIVTMLTGGTIQNFGSGFNLAGFSTGGNNDPTVGFIPVVQNMVQVDIDRRNVAYFEQLANLYEQLIEGESSGLSRLQVDQVRSQLIRARSNLVTDVLSLRNSNDQLKQQLGLPPDTPMMVDISLMQPYLDVFKKIDNWQGFKTESSKISIRSSTRFPSSKISSSMDTRCWECIEIVIRMTRKTVSRKLCRPLCESRWNTGST